MARRVATHLAAITDALAAITDALRDWMSQPIEADALRVRAFIADVRAPLPAKAVEAHALLCDDGLSYALVASKAAGDAPRLAADIWKPARGRSRRAACDRHRASDGERRRSASRADGSSCGISGRDTGQEGPDHAASASDGPEGDNIARAGVSDLRGTVE